MEPLKSQTGSILLNSLPKEERTYEICYEAVKLNKKELKYVPHKYRTNDLLKLMKHFNGVLKFIPYELKTFEICLDAVKRNRFDLQYVPRKFKTKDLCVNAVLERGHRALRYVPKKIISKEFFELINWNYEEGIVFYEKIRQKDIRGWHSF
jgi:hypothetical protein